MAFIDMNTPLFSTALKQLLPSTSVQSMGKLQNATSVGGSTPLQPNQADSFSRSANAVKAVVGSNTPSSAKNRDGLVVLYSVQDLVGGVKKAALKNIKNLTNAGGNAKIDLVRKIVEILNHNETLTRDARVFIYHVNSDLKELFFSPDRFKPLVQRLLTDEQGCLLVNQSVLDLLTNQVSEKIRFNRLLFFHTNTANVIPRNLGPAGNRLKVGVSVDNKGNMVGIIDPNLQGITAKVAKLLNDIRPASIQAVLQKVDVEIPTEFQGKPIGRDQKIGLVLLADTTRNFLRDAIDEHQAVNRNRNLDIDVDFLKSKLQSKPKKLSAQRGNDIQLIEKLLQQKRAAWGQGIYSSSPSQASAIIERLSGKVISSTDIVALRVCLGELLRAIKSETSNNPEKAMLYDLGDRVQCIPEKKLGAVAKALLRTKDAINEQNNSYRMSSRRG